MKGRQVRKKRRPVGRPPKPPGEKAIGIKLWIAGRDHRELASLAKPKRLSLQQYIGGLVRDDLARAVAGGPNGPVTDRQLFAVVRAALDLAEAAKGGNHVR